VGIDHIIDLPRFADPSITLFLRELLEMSSPGSKVWNQTVQALADTKDDRGIDALLRAFVDGVSQGPGNAATAALARYRHPRIVAQLSRHVQAGHQELRMAAAAALSQSQNPLAVDTLVAALEDTSSSVRQSAVEGLRSMLERDYGEDAALWRLWVNRLRNVRRPRAQGEGPFLSNTAGPPVRNPCRYRVLRD